MLLSKTKRRCVHWWQQCVKLNVAKRLAACALIQLTILLFFVLACARCSTSKQTSANEKLIIDAISSMTINSRDTLWFLDAAIRNCTQPISDRNLPISDLKKNVHPNYTFPKAIIRHSSTDVKNDAVISTKRQSENFSSQHISPFKFSSLWIVIIILVIVFSVIYVKIQHCKKNRGS